jgi:ribosomal protein S18 acetylase RimI-like enzyme
MFACGVPELDGYIMRYANQDLKRGYTTVFVACDELDSENIVIGYYAICTASISLTSLPHEITRKMPAYKAIPAIRLSRLAVDTKYHKMGIGETLILDAIDRACKCEIGWVMIIVDATNEDVLPFYHRFKFVSFEEFPMSLWLNRAVALKIAGSPSKINLSI